MSDPRADLRQELFNVLPSDSDGDVVIGYDKTAPGIPEWGPLENEVERLADALLPVIDRHVQAERERIAAAIERETAGLTEDQATDYDLGLAAAADIARQHAGDSDD